MSELAPHRQQMAEAKAQKDGTVPAPTGRFEIHVPTHAVDEDRLTKCAADLAGLLDDGSFLARYSTGTHCVFLLDVPDAFRLGPKVRNFCILLSRELGTREDEAPALREVYAVWYAITGERF